MNHAYRLTRALVLTLGFVIAGCSSLRTDFVKKPSQAQPAAFDTSSARYVRAELDAHKSLSGFRLLTSSTNALMSRVALADQAAHSIDLQYYIFQNDATGRLVAQHILAAADRGARVRMLLDDINLTDEDRLLDALDAHPNIQVRLFNPFHTRSPSLPSKIAQFVVDGPRLNRRMHNKSFIVDNTVAVIGGRNIGDAYFDAAGDNNFRDLDLVAIGPVVAEASRTFDDYWNSDAAYPVKAFRETRATEADLKQLRVELKQHAREFAQSDYAQAAFEELPHGASAARFGSWFWGPAELVADQPEKVEGGKDRPALRIGPKLKTVIDAASRRVLLISPYFVPGKTGTDYLVSLAKRGLNVSVLTNSLASTDEAAAHSGYARYRRDLLAGGVHLFELRPAPGGEKPISAGGTSSGVSLHAKAAVVDTRYAFVGSMNMDQRSKLLNTEMGIIVDSPELAAAVAQFFAKATLPASAYRVELQSEPGHGAGSERMVWYSENAGREEIQTSEPGVTRMRKVEVDLLRLLPIEGLL
ncbi:MAG TPA: phospholipase D family protein [Rudaea sp.]|jgi:putative cardiolipin synthase|uniref:phospholipase D family protein n=1 Tax=Rudaea sp. TaxID=2136325 RepID=UPI002F92C4E6